MEEEGEGTDSRSSTLTPDQEDFYTDGSPEDLHRLRWLTLSMKDGQAIIHVDPEDQEDFYTIDVRGDLLHRRKWLTSSRKSGQSNIRGDREGRGDLLHHQRSGAEIF